jgi:hypothetical protein
MARILLILSVAMAAISCDNPKPNGDGGGPIDLAVTPDLSAPPDLSGAAGEPTCTPPGALSCASGTFYATTTEAGCFATMPTGGMTAAQSTDNPAGPCSTVGDIVVACTHSPNCSFCYKSNLAIPTGCAKQ